MKKNMKNEKGFSLIELLVVVIIIGIIAAIAIPSLLSSRRSAQEASAISALRTISSAEAVFQAGPGGSVNYGFLSDLGLAVNGSLIDSTLAGGTKGVYTFAMTGPTAGTGAPAYCVTATPADPTTYRTYAISTDGVIRVNAGNLVAGAAPTCAANVATGGSVLN